MHKTSAWPLALLCALLIVYASLYPFTGWRDQGLSPLGFFWAPFPQFWTGFDVGVNLAGYALFGFLLALAALRTGRERSALWLALGAAALLSLAMEATQSYLPRRVPSNLDWGLNVLGGLLGAVVAQSLEKLGWLARWSRVRDRWFVPDARGGMVLLALWPWALLFPSSVPLGLGHVLERLEAALVGWLDEPGWIEWLPFQSAELRTLLPAGKALCVGLGALIPCLLGFCVIKGGLRRGLWVLGVGAAGLVVTALSVALSFGPGNAWDWLDRPTQIGLAAGMVVAALLAAAPARLAAALGILALGLFLGVLNQAPQGPYLEQSLHTWEQGRFIRFNGLAQWLGWLWPYVTLVYLLLRVGGAGPGGPRRGP